MAEEQKILEGKSIVVTGDLVRFPEPGMYPQRIEFRRLVESHGGKLTSSVSGKTSYLVCNDPKSSSTKAREARARGIPILTEDAFLALLTGEPVEPAVTTETAGEAIDQSKFQVENGILRKYTGEDHDVVVPSGVTDIGRIFAFNDLLRSVTIPEGVTEIADGAFMRCGHLKDISIPKTVKRIGVRAFEDCHDLRYVNIPEGVEVIGAGAFWHLDKLRSVVVPSTVKEIGESAFAYCENLTSLTLRDGVGAIHQNAFYRCTKLKHVSIPGSAQLGRNAFAYCTDLTTLELGPGMTQIGENAFSSCKQLRSVTIPEGVTHIMPWAFNRCTNLQKVSLPDSLLQIHDLAFAACSSLEEVILPPNLRIIGDGAFNFCDSLRPVEIPTSVTRRDMISVFHGCVGMCDSNGFLIFEDTLVNIHTKRSEVRIPEGIRKIGDHVLTHLSRECVENLIFPCTVREIGTHFGENSVLKDLCLPESITEVGEYFLRNSAIEILDLPMTVTHLPEGALDKCTQLQCLIAPGLSFQEVKEQKLLVPATIGFLHATERYTLEQMAAYGRYAASQKQKIVPVLLKTDDVQGITAYGELEKITADNFEDGFLQPALKANATQCIAYLLDWRNKHISADMLDKLLMKALDKDPCDPKEMRKHWRFEELPDGTMNLYVYKGSESDLIIPPRIGEKSVSTIGPFAASPMNKTVKKPQREINNAIKTVVIGDEVQTIRQFAFCQCSALQSLTMGDSVKVIEKGAFQKCTALVDVAFSPGLREISEAAFECCRVRVLELPEGLEKLGAGAFRDCNDLRSVSLPSSLHTIEALTFAGTSISDLEIPDGVERIAERAFWNCSDLVRLQLPRSLKCLEENAFFRCKNLKEVEIPEGAQKLGNWVFSYCTKLERIRIPQSVSHIDDHAFMGCEKLTIHAPEGSVAHTFAEQHKIPFVAE